MGERKFDTKQLEHVVERRVLIGKVLLDLWKVFDRPRALKHSRATLAHLLLGSAFSLWQAAFLIKKSRKRKAVTTHAKKFLGILLADNAIAYSQDRETSEWTAGYYVNSAHYRLVLARKWLSLHGKEKAAFDKIAKFIDDQQGRKDYVPDLIVGWRNAYEATEIAMRKLDTMLRSA
jgi:hypothetical protein